jgi:hypothetical protein
MSMHQNVKFSDDNGRIRPGLPIRIKKIPQHAGFLITEQRVLESVVLDHDTGESS